MAGAGGGSGTYKMFSFIVSYLCDYVRGIVAHFTYMYSWKPSGMTVYIECSSAISRLRVRFRFAYDQLKSHTYMIYRRILDNKRTTWSGVSLLGHISDQENLAGHKGRSLFSPGRGWRAKVRSASFWNDWTMPLWREAFHSAMQCLGALLMAPGEVQGNVPVSLVQDSSPPPSTTHPAVKHTHQCTL